MKWFYEVFNLIKYKRKLQPLILESLIKIEDKYSSLKYSINRLQVRYSKDVTESTIIATIHCPDIGYCLFGNPLVSCTKIGITQPILNLLSCKYVYR